MNGVDSLGSNQECRIGFRHSHSRVSQCLASIRKLGNRRSSEGLRSEKRFHASCSNLSDNELLRIECGDGAWYCTNCKADCGLVVVLF